MDTPQHTAHPGGPPMRRVSSSALAGLPRHFIAAMRKLFLILDQDQDGWVRVEDVSSRWKPVSDNAEHLPENLIEHLERMCTADGRLSFERFMTGIKIAILKHEAAKNKVDIQDIVTTQDNKENSSVPLSRANSLPNILDDEPCEEGKTARPLASGISENDLLDNEERLVQRRGVLTRTTSLGPPKPPRDPLRASGVFTFSRRDIEPQENNNEYVNIEVGKPQGPFAAHNSQDVTLSRRMKQWEEERKVLMEGSSILRKGQDTYECRLREVEKKIANGVWHGVDDRKYNEAEEERTMFELRALRDIGSRIEQLNRPGAAMALISSESHGESNIQDQLLQNQIIRLKEQNRQLTEEVGRKGSVIAELEGEKAELIKQLFQAKSTSEVVSRRVPLTTQSASNILNRDSSTLPMKSHKLLF